MNMILSEQEKKNLLLHADSLELAVEQVNTNGYVVIENVIDSEKILNISLKAQDLIKQEVMLKGFNTGKNRLQMYLPFMHPFIDDEIIANPIALSIIDEILGNQCRCGYFASDTAFPDSDYQTVHADAWPLFHDFTGSLPTYNLVVNIPLVDTTLENGPLEIWPGGTHLLPDHKVHSTLKGLKNKYIDVNRASSYMVSEKVLMPAGSIVVRDMRTWHRGTPNHSNHNRTNLAFVYSKAWYGLNANIQIPQDTYDSLSDRGKRLFRFEKIGYPVKMPSEFLGE